MSALAYVVCIWFRLVTTGAWIWTARLNSGQIVSTVRDAGAAKCRGVLTNNDL